MIESMAQTDAVVKPNESVNFDTANKSSLWDKTIKLIKKKNEKAEIEEYHTFEFHGKHFNFEKRSCYIFSYENRFRRAMIWLMTWKWF